MMAAEEGHSDLVRLLLEARAYQDAVDNDGAPAFKVEGASAGVAQDPALLCFSSKRALFERSDVTHCRTQPVFSCQDEKIRQEVCVPSCCLVAPGLCRLTGFLTSCQRTTFLQDPFGCGLRKRPFIPSRTMPCRGCSARNCSNSTAHRLRRGCSSLLQDTMFGWS